MTPRFSARHSYTRGEAAPSSSREIPVRASAGKDWRLWDGPVRYGNVVWGHKECRQAVRHKIILREKGVAE